MSEIGTYMHSNIINTTIYSINKTYSKLERTNVTNKTMINLNNTNDNITINTLSENDIQIKNELMNTTVQNKFDYNKYSLIYNKTMWLILVI